MRWRRGEGSMRPGWARSSGTGRATKRAPGRCSSSRFPLGRRSKRVPGFCSRSAPDGATNRVRPRNPPRTINRGMTWKPAGPANRQIPRAMKARVPAWIRPLPSPPRVPRPVPDKGQGSRPPRPRRRRSNHLHERIPGRRPLHRSRLHRPPHRPNRRLLRRRRLSRPRRGLRPLSRLRPVCPNRRIPRCHRPPRPPPRDHLPRRLDSPACCDTPSRVPRAG